MRSLEVLATEAEACTKCDLHMCRTRSVFSRGRSTAQLMFVGEGPGASEDTLGVPFVGRSGELLDKMIAAMGMRHVDAYITNVVKCRPPENRKPEPNEMASCMPYLHEQIANVKPRVIVTLGATATHALVGMSEGITRTRGTWKVYGEIPVMPTYHPAYLLRDPVKKRDAWEDLQQVMRLLERERGAT